MRGQPWKIKIKEKPARERDKARVGRDGAAGLSRWTPELGPHVCIVAPKRSGDSLLKDNSGASAGGQGWPGVRSLARGRGTGGLSVPPEGAR